MKTSKKQLGTSIVRSKELPLDFVIFLSAALGGWIVGGLVYLYMWQMRENVIEIMTDDLNMRTKLINWIMDEGRFLGEDEFMDQYNEKCEFINLVTTVDGEG